MAVVYSNALKDTRMTAVITAIDAGTAGSIEIGTTGMGAVLVSIPLAKPSFSEASQAITMLSTPRSATATATNTAAAARIKDSSGNIIVSGLTVGVSGADINLSSVNIATGQTVSITSGTITHG